MSQRNVVRRQCDFCNASQDFSQELTPAQERDMGNWVTMVKEHMVDGQLMAISKHACKTSCASNLISTGALELPAQDTTFPPEKIAHA